MGTRRDNPRRTRCKELEREIGRAKTVEAVKSLQGIVENERGFLGEKAYRDLSLGAAKRMNKVGAKEKKIALGPLGEFGGTSEGKVL
jgi:hypothetical protein